MPKKTIVLASVIFFASFTPLILFDVRHNFVNIGGIRQYITDIQSKKSGAIAYSPLETILYVPRSLSRTLFVGGNRDLARQYSYCSQHASGRLAQVHPLMILGIVLLFWFVWTKRKESQYSSSVTLLLLPFLATYCGITLYGLVFRGDLFDHYMAVLFPLFFILVAFGLYQLSKRFPYLIIGALPIFLAVNISHSLNAVHRFGYQDKINAVDWVIKQTGDNPFSLDVISTCFAYNGYRYLFYARGKEPSKSYVDANFSYLYDTPPAFEHPKLLVVITNPDFQETPSYYEEYHKYKQKLIQSAQFGTIEVMLVDNSNLDFVGKF